MLQGLNFSCNQTFEGTFLQPLSIHHGTDSVQDGTDSREGPHEKNDWLQGQVERGGTTA